LSSSVYSRISDIVVLMIYHDLEIIKKIKYN